ncbi:MAG: protein translocase subunit SecD [Deltaproteobacteria bacterium]|nr:protein translocase subunit SecD [Deltaproteobacteria bacterium]MBI3294349.1 protein translocase subunit SecD [Deltaproteobacteria bacterium]
MKGLTWRFTVVAFSILFSIYLLVPTILKYRVGKPVSRIKKADDPWYYAMLPAETLKLGLDLMGGLHLVLGIDFDEVKKDSISKLKNSLKDSSEREKIEGLTFEVTGDRKIIVRFTDKANWKKLDDLIGKEFKTVIDFVSESGTEAVLKITESHDAYIKQRAVDQSLETLRNRIDEFGIAEPIIQRQGEEKILVQFPGIQETGRLKDIISRTAKLSFQIEKSGPEEPDGTPHFDQLKAWVAEFESKGHKLDGSQPVSKFVKELNAYLGDKLPKGSEILFSKKVNVNTREAEYIPYLLEIEPIVSGDELEDANYTFDQTNNEPIVTFQLNPSGAVKFEKATGDNTGKFMAIVLDSNVHSAPRIKTRIGGGRAQIDMGGSGKNSQELYNEARDTALVLRSGALPARLEFLEERTIGPSLGADAIRAGTSSLLGGLVVIFIFMGIYYRSSGLVAVAALTLNGLFVLSCMAAFEGTLTLPGLAGLTLTLGMAIDANVLIFEHVREELIHGKSASLAIAEGYKRAFSAIIDTHMTAIISGLVLMSFGYGPIRGFSVTLLIGIIVSLFTSVFITRVIFDYRINHLGTKSISI